MIDEGMRMWLLEVNLSPGCEGRTPFLERMLERMSKRLLEVAVGGQEAPDGEKPDWIKVCDDGLADAVATGESVPASAAALPAGTFDLVVQGQGLRAAKPAGRCSKRIPSNPPSAVLAQHSRQTQDRAAVHGGNCREVYRDQLSSLEDCNVQPLNADSPATVSTLASGNGGQLTSDADSEDLDAYHFTATDFNADACEFCEAASIEDGNTEEIGSAERDGDGFVATAFLRTSDECQNESGQFGQADSGTRHRQRSRNSSWSSSYGSSLLSTSRSSSSRSSSRHSSSSSQESPCCDEEDSQSSNRAEEAVMQRLSDQRGAVGVSRSTSVAAVSDSGNASMIRTDTSDEFDPEGNRDPDQ
jgi:hypothetical protein